MGNDTAREPFFVSWEGRPVKDLVPGVRIQVVSGEKLMFSRVVVDPNAVHHQRARRQDAERLEEPHGREPVLLEALPVGREGALGRRYNRSYEASTAPVAALR